MRAAGTIVMGFGAFFISVALMSIVGPALGELGIIVHAETTSVIGTALIGFFAFTTGTLLRRRAFEAARARRALGTSAQTPPAALRDGGAAESLRVPRVDREAARPGRNETR